MTIYTPGQADKESKNTTEPEVVTEPLTSFKDDDVEADMAPKLVRVTYFPRNRRTFCVHLLLTIMVMVILTCGAIGAVVFYRHLNKKVYTGTCGTRYYDPEYHELRGDVVEVGSQDYPQRPSPAAHYKAHLKMDYLKEGIEVSRVDQYEHMHTPAFDEVRENSVWHDFQWNYTAILDPQLGRCYIMPLDRASIAPPTDIIDLLEKLTSGYYMKSAEVIRQDYNVMREPIDDLSPYGSRIVAKCGHYRSYWLEKYVHGVSKRNADDDDSAADSTGSFTLVYAVVGNRVQQPRIFKVIVNNAEGLDAEEENAEQADE